MKIENVHKKIGIVMLIPLLLWAVTGLVFLTKPGYEDAYIQLEPKHYKIEREVRLPQASQWNQVKILRTILGYHLIVSNDGQWIHLDPFTFNERPHPTKDEMAVLINDAISTNKKRFGNIVEIEENIVTTDTDVQITLEWHTLKLHQSGRDTRLINTLYKIHYLQWLGSPTLDKIFGVIGLVGLVALTIFGLAIYAKKIRSTGT
jgi:hypothetical protein